MAPHSSTFAWKIPWTEEPGRLQSMGLLESDTTERTAAVRSIIEFMLSLPIGCLQPMMSRETRDST